MIKNEPLPEKKNNNHLEVGKNSFKKQTRLSSNWKMYK
jgi:hypothetical protein